MADSRTSFYVSNLHPTYRRHLGNISQLSRGLDDGEKAKAREHIKAYLMALNDAGIISDVAFRCLYTYYTLNL